MNRIEINPRICGGQPVIRGTRISVTTLLEQLREEKSWEAFYHLDQAVANGFREMDKIMSHEALAYIRVTPEFELFRKNQFRISDQWMSNLKNVKREEAFMLKQEVPLTLNKENI